jgi:hypothetical protein
VIATDTLQQIYQRIQTEGVREEILSVLRQDYPDLHFTWCMDDDVGPAKAVMEATDFNLYLIDGREHCLCLTNDADVATGVVVAEIIEDD